MGDGKKALKSNDVDDFIAEQLEAIDEKIREIDNSRIVKAAEALLDQKMKLQSARRSLLGAGSKTGGNAGARVTQAEVVARMEIGEEYTVEALAAEMGHTPEVIRGHLNRGKGERFTKNHDGSWSLRDPEVEA